MIKLQVNQLKFLGTYNKKMIKLHVKQLTIAHQQQMIKLQLKQLTIAHQQQIQWLDVCRLRVRV
jgi:hypothetical protein